MSSDGTSPRTRNVGIRTVKVSDLEDAPWNFRTHPKQQVEALGDAIEELGFFGYPDTYETEDGILRLIDGHCRKEHLLAKYGPNVEIEVNVTDFDETQAKKATATKDPLTAMAEVDAAKLDSLLQDIDTGSEALQQMFADMAAESGLYNSDGESSRGGDKRIEALYQVVVECDSESEQKALWESLKKEGRKCRLLTV